MANPRQRRKSRSGTAKVKDSKATVKNRHKVIVKGPAILTESWDKSKTVTQNYRKLGLLCKLNPRQAGGIEPIEPKPFSTTSLLPTEEQQPEYESSADEADMEDDVVKPIVVEQEKLAKGQGRIIRDPITGKVLRIVMGGEGEDGGDLTEEVKERVAGESDSDDDDDSDEEVDFSKLKRKSLRKNAPVEAVQKPWGEAMEIWSGEESDFDESKLEEDNLEEYNQPRSTGQGIAVGLPRRRIIAKTDVVRQLESLASNTVKVIRHTSVTETDWLISLVEKYDDDVQKMVRDKKLNVWQKTFGEITRQIYKAGGVQSLRDDIAERLAEATAAADSAPL